MQRGRLAAVRWTLAQGKSARPPTWSASKWVSTTWPDVPGIEAERAYRADRGFGLVENGADEVPCEAEVRAWLCGIPKADATVHQYQPVAGFQQQHVTDQAIGRSQWPHRAAVEVVYPHGQLSRVGGVVRSRRGSGSAPAAVNAPMATRASVSRSRGSRLSSPPTSCLSTVS